MAEKSMIALKNVTVSYDNQNAIENLNLEIKPQELFVLVGESGGGKTTTLRTMNGLVKPTNGQIIINGVLMKRENVRQIRLEIGYVIQQIALFPNMNVEQNLRLIPEIKHEDMSAAKDRIEHLMKSVSLPLDYLKDFPNELSGGEQQRVGIIRAFGTKPKIVLMDEPFAALDPISRVQLQNLTLQFHSQFNNTIVFVTHDMNEALKLADRIGVIANGKLLQVGTPKEIVRHPADSYVERLFRNSRSKDINKVYIQRIVYTGFSSSSPQAEIPVVKVDGESILADNYPFLAAGKQLEVHQDNKIIGYVSSADVFKYFNHFKENK